MSDFKLDALIAEEMERHRDHILEEEASQNLPGAQQRSIRRQFDPDLLGPPLGTEDNVVVSEASPAQQTAQTIMDLKQELFRETIRSGQLQQVLDEIIQGVDTEKRAAVQAAIGSADLTSLVTLVVEDQQAINRDLRLENARWSELYHEVNEGYTNQQMEYFQLYQRMTNEVAAKTENQQRLAALQAQSDVDTEQIQQLERTIEEQSQSVRDLQTQVENSQQLQTAAQTRLVEAQARVVELDHDLAAATFRTPFGSRRGSLDSVQDLSLTDQPSDDPPPPRSFMQVITPAAFNATMVTLLWGWEKTRGEDLMGRAHIGKLADSYVVPLMVMASVYTGISVFRLQRTVPTSYLVFFLTALSGYYATGDMPKIEIASIFQTLDLQIARLGSGAVAKHISPVLGNILDKVIIDTEESSREMIIERSVKTMIPEVTQIGLYYELTKWKNAMQWSITELLTAANKINQMSMGHAHPVLPTIAILIGGGKGIVYASGFLLGQLSGSLTNVWKAETLSKENMFNTAQKLIGDQPAIAAPTAFLTAAVRLVSGAALDERDTHGLVRPVLSIAAAIFVLNCVTLALNLRDWIASKSSWSIFRPLLTNAQGEVVDVAGKYSMYLAATLLCYIIASVLFLQPDNVQEEVIQWFVLTGALSYTLRNQVRRL